MKIINEVPAKIIIGLYYSQRKSLEGLSSSRISRKIESTYSGVVKAIKELSRKGLIIIKEKNKREKKIILTDLGSELARYLIKIQEIMK